MGRKRRVAAIVTALMTLAPLASAGTVAVDPADEAAMKPTRQPADRNIEGRVNSLLVADDARGEAAAAAAALRRPGHRRRTRRRASARCSASPTRQKINHLQHVAVEQSRLHIPILFAYDTIHGYRTIFPVPLGAASSFDPRVAAADDRFGARESAAVGIKQIYCPMVDVSHEPRWGRIAEGAGEDPYLGSVFAAARVKAAQGDDYSAPDKVVDQRQALRGVRSARGRPRLQHDRHVRAAAAQPVPAAVQGRGRRRRRHGDVLVQRDQRRRPAAATATPRPTSSRASGASTASSRATTPRSPRCAPARPGRPTSGPCGHGVAADGPARRAGAERRHRLGDGQHQHPRLRQAAAGPGPDLDARGSTTPYAGSCG